MASDEKSFVITGMGGAPPSGTLALTGLWAGALSGRLTKVNLAGIWEWSKSYSSVDFSLGGSTEIIKNECWGVAPLSDGYIIGCGTG